MEQECIDLLVSKKDEIRKNFLKHLIIVKFLSN